MAKRRPPPSDAEMARLHDLSYNTCKSDSVTLLLEARGLATNGTGRFGGYAKITDAGTQYLLLLNPEAGAGLAKAGTSLGVAPTPNSGKGATKRA